MFIKQHININALIKCWLFFMGCFAIARYPLSICIVVGLIGGLAGGMLSRWWQLTSTPEPVESDKKSRLPKPIEALRQRIQAFGSQRQTKRSSYRMRPRVGLFGRTYPQQTRRSRSRRPSRRRSRSTSDE